MALREEFEHTGNWLFRRRSYLPLLMTLLVLLALRKFHYPAHSHRLDRLWEIGCFLLSCVGLGIRILVTGYAPKGTSGRGTGEQVAETLTTTGIYAIVRHPLYLGNFFMGLGVSLFIRRWWFSLIYTLVFWLYYERIMFAEEEFLRHKFGERYLAWAQRTPAFLPRLANWQPPGRPFSLKWVLRRENSSFFAILVTFTLLDLVSEFIVNRRLTFDRMWVAFFSVGLVVYLTIRVLSKKTTLLSVTNR